MSKLEPATALSILASALLLAGCGSSGDGGGEGKVAQDEPQTAPPASAAEAEPQEAPPVATVDAVAEIPLEQIGLVDAALHQEPAKDAWQGEVFNDLATAQLKALGKLIEHPENISAATLATVARPDLDPSPLLLPVERLRFEDASFRVATTASELPEPGAKPLDAALREIARRFSPGTARTKFKIFSVALDESGSPVCDAYFRLSGRTAGGISEHHATWRCSWIWPNSNTDPILKSIAVTEVEEALGKTSGAQSEPLFSDATASVFRDVKGFRDQFARGTDHWAARLERRYGIGLSGWHGLAVGDANGDGLDDLYVCEPGGLPNRLYIAKPDGTVFDASPICGADFRLQTQSALFVDLDNDADQDLVLATTLGVVFLANDGRGSFAVKGQQLVPEAAPICLAAADYDLDGDLDIYTGCYSLRSSVVDGVQILGRPIPYHDANNGGRNVLFRNDRNWKFTNATLELGLDSNNRRFTLAASWDDYDGDGDADLYVANDYGRNNLFRNDRDTNGDSRFVDVAKEAGVEDISAGMSVSWGDADGDGDRDLYVSNMWSSAGNRIAFQRNFLSGAEEAARAEFQRHARGNSLFLNNGDGTFADASVEAGVTMGRWAWGSLFADINADGREDIVVANGFITQPDDDGDL